MRCHSVLCSKWCGGDLDHDLTNLESGVQRLLIRIPYMAMLGYAWKFSVVNISKQFRLSAFKSSHGVV